MPASALQCSDLDDWFTLGIFRASHKVWDPQPHTAFWLPRCASEMILQLKLTASTVCPTEPPCDDRNAPCSVSAAHYSNHWSCVAVKHVKCGNRTEFLAWFNDSGFPSEQPRAAGGYLMWRALIRWELHVAPAQPSVQAANMQRRTLPSLAPPTSHSRRPLYSSPQSQPSPERHRLSAADRQTSFPVCLMKPPGSACPEPNSFLLDAQAYFSGFPNPSPTTGLWALLLWAHLCFLSAGPVSFSWGRAAVPRVRNPRLSTRTHGSEPWPCCWLTVMPTSPRFECVTYRTAGTAATEQPPHLLTTPSIL